VDFLEPYFLLREGRTDEAVQRLIAVLAAIRKAGGEEQREFESRIFMRLLGEFVPRHLPVIVARLDAMEVASGPNVDLTRARDRLTLPSLGTDDTIAFLEQASARHPAELEHPVRLYQIYAHEGRMAEALQVLERLHQIDRDEIVY